MRNIIIVLLAIITVNCGELVEGLEEIELTQDQKDSLQLIARKPYWYDTIPYNMELEIHLAQQDVDTDLDGIILARELVENADRFLHLDFTKYPSSLATDIFTYIPAVRYLEITALEHNVSFNNMHRLYSLQILDSRLDSLIITNQEPDLNMITLSGTVIDSIYIEHTEIQSFRYFTYSNSNTDVEYSTAEIDYSLMPNLLSIGLGGQQVESIDVSTNVLLNDMFIDKSEVECIRVHERHLNIFDPIRVPNMTTEECN